VVWPRTKDFRSRIGLLLSQMRLTVLASVRQSFFEILERKLSFWFMALGMPYFYRKPPGRNSCGLVAQKVALLLTFFSWASSVSFRGLILFQLLLVHFEGFMHDESVPDMMRAPADRTPWADWRSAGFLKICLSDGRADARSPHTDFEWKDASGISMALGDFFLGLLRDWRCCSLFRF
jgi:hypothetical protein